MKQRKFFTAILALLVLVALILPISGDEYDTTKTLEQSGILEGYEDGELHLEKTITRAEFAKIIVNSFYVDAVEEEIQFSDLSSTHWAYSFIKKAVSAGLLKGHDNGKFCPDDEITLEQAAAVVCRALGIYAQNYPVDYISTAIDYGIIDNVVALIGDKVTRGQIAEMIVNSKAYEDNLDNDNTQNKVYSTGGASRNSTVAFSDMDMESVDSAKIIMPPYEHPIIFPDNFNTEEYVSYDENVFKDVLTSPLSTFSIDTDTASYSNMRRFILGGQIIAEGAIRTEELINYFDYEKAETEDGKPFGVRTQSGVCPWNEDNLLTMITVSGEELLELSPSNIVFLIDISGSMYSRNKLPLVKNSLEMLLNELDERDTVSIVTYASGTRVALMPTPAINKETILNTISSLNAGGGTAGSDGISHAYRLAEENKVNGNNRIILCTDGDFNIGPSSTAELEALITQKRDNGIFLSVLGFGMGNYKDNRMETLADKGNGNYAYIDNIREAKKVLVDDMTKTIFTIAKDVKIQTEFNPQKVSEYRLIGYENRRLENEDFENDKKDAGELGAGATVTVFYEIALQGEKAKESTLKYQTSTATGSDDLMLVKIRYKNPDSDESILSEYPVASDLSENTSDDYRFASAVAQLGMLLNKSEYAENITLDSIIEQARAALGSDKFGLRNEFVQLVDLLRYTTKHIK